MGSYRQDPVRGGTVKNGIFAKLDKDTLCKLKALIFERAPAALIAEGESLEVL